MFDFGVLHLSDLQACGYEEIIKARMTTVFDYRLNFLHAKKIALGKGEETKASALNLLSDICFLNLDSLNVNEPFLPIKVVNDFNEEYVKILSEFLEEIQDPELAARVADFLYVKQKNKKYGNIAIDNYIKTSDSDYFLAKWFECFKRLERALRLAVRIKEKDKIKIIIEKMLEKLEPKNKIPNPMEAIKILNLLLEITDVDRRIIATKSISLAETVIDPERYDIKGVFFNIADRAYMAMKDSVNANNAREKQAECLLIKARCARKPGKMIGACPLYANATSVFLKCKNGKDKVDSLKDECSEVIRAAEKEMEKFSIPIDLSNLANEAINAAKGKDIFSSLNIFSRLIELPRREILEDEILNTLEDSPLSYTFEKNILREGRLLAIIPPLLGSEGKDYNIALTGAYLEHVGIHCFEQVYGVILPVRNEILKCGPINRSVLFNLLKNSSFIPSDRLSIWVKGFLAGFENDFDIALSLLIPQFEHALRKILEVKGAIVWNIDKSTKLHSEKSLNQLFEMDECLAFLGKDMHFLLKGFLIERVGFNIRNDISHGLLNDEQFNTPSIIYLWWLLFHFVLDVKKPDQTNGSKYENNNATT